MDIKEINPVIAYTIVPETVPDDDTIYQLMYRCYKKNHNAD